MAAILSGAVTYLDRFNETTASVVPLDHAPVAGDLIVVFEGRGSHGTTESTYPAGFAKAAGPTPSNASDSGGSVWYKIADGAEGTSITITPNQAFGGGGFVAVIVEGADTSAPIGTITTLAPNNLTSFATGAYTTTTDGSLLLFWATLDATTGTADWYTGVTGMTEAYEREMTSGQYTTLWTQGVATAGVQGDKTVTTAGDRPICFYFEVKAASAATGAEIVATVGTASAAGLPATVSAGTGGVIAATLGTAQASGLAATVAAGRQAAISATAGGADAAGLPAVVVAAATVQPAGIVGSGMGALYVGGVRVVGRLSDAGIGTETADAIAATVGAAAVAGLPATVLSGRQAAITATVGIADAAGLPATVAAGRQAAVDAVVGTVAAAGLPAVVSTAAVVYPPPSVTFAAGASAGASFAAPAPAGTPYAAGALPVAFAAGDE